MIEYSRNMENNVKNKSITLGAFESVSLPMLKIENVIAKIDTGAYSGAIHCVNIKEERLENGEKILHFTPFNETMDPITTKDYLVTHIKTSNGHRMKRYLIDTDIIIKNKQYTVRIGLSNRSDLHKQVLIGRRFIRQNKMLIDVKINQQFEKNYRGKL